MFEREESNMPNTIKKHIKRKVRRRKKLKSNSLVSLMMVVGIVVFGYLYINGYIDLSLLIPEEQQPNYSAAQNEEGYYFYQWVDQNDYYYNANHLIGIALFESLNEILNNGYTAPRYEDAKTVLSQADRSLDDPTKVVNIYTGLLVDATWDSTSWHREHVWPNSRLGIPRVSDSSRNQGSDLHNLRAITPSVNSSRGDRYFNEGSGSNQTTPNGGYYPGDDHRGDVARILFYMATMYDFLTLTDDDLEDTSNHYTPEGAMMGKLSLLLQWHREDPVDDFERQRNQVIYEFQGNRNPFIDQPAYVHLIWEEMEIEDLTETEVLIHIEIVLFTMERKRGVFNV